MFRRLRELLVQPVPEALSVCEFDCPVTQCTRKTWSTCTLRSPLPQNGSRSIPLTAYYTAERPRQDAPQIVMRKQKFNR
jgi:hypothetical protein